MFARTDLHYFHLYKQHKKTEYCIMADVQYVQFSSIVNADNKVWLTTCFKHKI